MKILHYSTLAAALCLLGAQTALADDFNRDQPREAVYCFPAKYVSQIQSRLSDMDKDKRDVVDIAMAPRFTIHDGGALPDRYFLRGEAGELAFTVQPDGTVPDFLSVIEAGGGTGDICIEDMARMGRPGDDESLYFEMGLSPTVQSAGPRYEYADLREAAKDGKSLYKIMVPRVARMFMPDTDHFYIEMKAAEATPVVQLDNGGMIETTAFGDGYVFALEAVKAAGAQAVVIEGGPHSLSPVPSIKTMQRFGMGEKKIYTQNEKGDWVR